MRDDSWLWDRVAQSQFAGGAPNAVIAADLEPFIVISSGPFQLSPQRSAHVGAAWIFGSNEQDFFRNRRMAQSIYDAGYRAPRAPEMPTLQANEMEGGILLAWDTSAVLSFDRYTRSFDFEGFKLYRGVMPDNIDIISSWDPVRDGFMQILGAWDLANGIRGEVPNGIGGTFDLGTDSGLEAIVRSDAQGRRAGFGYADTTAIRGQAYFYAIVAYDHGILTEAGERQTPLPNPVTIRRTSTGFSTSDNVAIITRSSVDVGRHGMVPESFALHQNYPNPFHPETRVHFSLPRSLHVTLEIFDLLGRRHVVVVDTEVPAGMHEVTLNASQLASGTYVLRMRAGEFESARKIVLSR